MIDQAHIPQAPAGLPADVAEKWRTAFSDILHMRLLHEIPRNHATALDAAKKSAYGAANELLRTPELKSYSEALELPAWHFQLREPSSDGRTLRVVTRHGDKYTFPIPEKGEPQ